MYAVASAGAVPLVLGGDHSIALPDATGVARHLGYGKVSMIHFDAHADTGDIAFGSLYGHGQPMRRLIESGALRGDRFLQMGLRGYWPGPETLDWMAEQNMRSYEMTEIGARGLDACLDEAFEIALDECDAVFLSVDIDVCDPGHAPGTGTPEPGGLSSRQLLDAVRRICRELPVAGIDVVEVSPPYDHAEITAFLANRVCLEALSGLAAQEGRDHPRPGRAAAGGTLTSTLFRGGAVFDGHRSPRPRDVLVRDGRIAAVGTRARRDRRRGASSVGGLVAPGFVDAHVHPIQGGLERMRCDLSELRTREEYLAADRASTPPRTPTSSGSSAAAGRCRPSPAATRWPRDLDAVVPDRPVFLPNRDHHGAWVNSRALEIAGIDAGTPGPAGRPHRAGRRRPPDRHPARGRDLRWSPAPAAHDRSRDYRAALLAGQAYLHSLGVTAGRTRSSARTPAWTTRRRPTCEAARSGELTVARRRARCGGTAGRAWSRSRDLVGRREATARRPVPGHEREDHAGRRRRERHGRDARRPTSTGAATRPHNAGHSFVDAGGAHGRRRRARRRGLPGARARDRRPRRARGARRVRRGTDPARRHHIAHLQVVHPDDVPRFAELGVAANMQALWAVHDEQMVDLTIPFLGAERARLAVPVRRPAPRRRPAGRGQRLAGQHPRPAGGDPHRGEPDDAYGEAGRAGPSRSCPSRRSTSRPRSRRTPPAARGSTTATTRAGVLRREPSPTWSCSTGTRSPGPAEEIGAARVRLDLGRRDAGLRSLTGV